MREYRKRQTKRAADGCKAARILWTLVICLLTLGGVSACGAGGKEDHPDPQEVKLRQELASFCEEMEEMDAQFRGLTVESEADLPALSEKLGDLQTLFSDLREMEFPESYADLGDTADEAAAYMDTAAEAFREVFFGESMQEAYVQAKYDYAMENYDRAFKRVRAILYFFS
ncbi:MAG: hypothetical protein K6E92_06160 [Lachnospiraceae bacterium]|nr:hypothetical protein [Lachnospiraceae bacterium]